MENSHSVSNEEEEDDGTHRVLLHSYLRDRFDLSSSINFIDMNGFSQLGPRTLIRVTLEDSKWNRWILWV